jgi:2-polyprenyl-3-methyl-5-hydroxy-6-metoxy-1,4-benzoquinol methylase
MKCRHCGQPVTLPFCDLGTAPPSNAYLRADQLDAPERHYPLRVKVCGQCWLAQTQDFAGAGELFDAEYGYFSSTSSSWLAHAKAYALQMAQRFGLGPQSHVVEVAANDGYLLRHVQALGVPCTGIEPTASTATAARALGLNVIEEFFGTALAGRLRAQGLAADLMAANNVLAHVPDINDFVAGFAHLLKPTGVATFEFPQLLNLVRFRQFDTLYHEHFSYLSLTAVQHIFQANGLQVFDVEELPTHGGSLRVYAQRADTGAQAVTAAVGRQWEAEAAAGIETPAFYAGVQAAAEDIKNALLRFLLDAQRDGLKVAAYGAAAKGNTLLNFAGVRPDLLPYVVDRSPGKVGRYLPGSRIPIVTEAHLRAHRPDRILILPWNIAQEVTGQLAYAREWGARFVVAVPELTLLD